MEAFEIFKTIMPAIITGIFTFFITKYTYNKNIPLVKLEISYNRIYYPLYKLINDKNDKDDKEKMDLIIDKSQIYFNKYSKYVDISTLKIFDILCGANTNAKKKAAYQIFKSNIYDRCSYLRRRLGYLEPNFFQLYKYSSSSEKSTFRIAMEFCIIYILSILGSIVKDKLQVIIILCVILFILILIFELLLKFVMFIYYKIKK